jgi:hypothetical protein
MAKKAKMISIAVAGFLLVGGGVTYLEIHVSKNRDF